MPDPTRPAGFVPDGFEPDASAHPEAKIGPDPNANVYPWRRAVVKGAVDALPVLGGAVGAAVGGGPEDVPAVALGVGAGRGLRDLIAEKLGLEPETSPAGKAARIALDTAMAGAAPTVLERLRDVVTNPKGTLADLLETVAHPQKQLGEVIDFLRRPQTTGSMGTTRPPLRFPAPAAAEPVAAAPTEVMPRGTPPAPGKSPQQILNEQAIQARRDLLVAKGASPQQAAAAVPSAASAPTVDPAPGPASAPAPAQSPPPGSAPVQRAMEHPTVDELEQFQRLLDRGMSKADARRQIEVMRELIAKTGASTDAQLRAEMARLAVSGQKSLMPIYGPKTP